MRESPLQTIVQASEIFQEFLKLAAVDGFISFWCFEITLHNGIEIPVDDIQEESRHHILGLHSLNYLLQKKLEEDNHETGLKGCSCGWEPSCVPKFEHTAIDRYTVGTVIRWSEGECHVLLAPQEGSEGAITNPVDPSSDAEDSVRSNEDTIEDIGDTKPETSETQDEPDDSGQNEIESDNKGSPTEPSFFQNYQKVCQEIADVTQTEPTSPDYMSDMDEDNSRMLVINEDVNPDEKSPSPDSAQNSQMETLSSPQNVSPIKASTPAIESEEEDVEDDDDDDSSSVSSSSSSSSSYSSTSSDDDDRISFKQRVEQAAKAAREAEASAAANSLLLETQNQETEELPIAHPPDIPNVMRHPDDIQAAQGLAALGKTQEFIDPPTPLPKQPKTGSKISQKLIEGQAFDVIRVSGNKFQCSVCGKQYDRYTKVLEHQTIHTGQKPWQCNQCTKKFTNYSSLLIHQRAKHTPAHLQQFNCYVCHKNFGSHGVLQTHMNTHASTKPHACSICGRTFALKTTRDTHEAQHTGNRPWQCNVCGKSYVTKYKLNLHMKAHTGELFCSLCDREFNSQDVLTRHKKRHEAGLITARSNAGSSSSGLNQKNRPKRGSKKSVFGRFVAPEFKCQVCSKIFSKNSDLSHHLSYCTSIAYCSNTQASSHQPLLHDASNLPLGVAINSCLVEAKKLNPYSCSNPPVALDNRPYMMNVISAEQLNPTLNYQQVIHPDDPILQSLHQ